MKISCPSCSAKYSIADEKVQNRLAKIRCRKCGTSIVIDGNASPPQVTSGDAPAPAVPAAAPAEAPASVYSVDMGENDQRQMTIPEIVEAYNAGSITAETYVWADGFPDWTSLGQVEDIVTALHQAANADAPTAPTDELSAAAASAAPAETPWEAPAAAPQPEPAAAQPEPAAAQPAPAQPAPEPAAPAEPARAPAAVAAGGPDLFGGVAQGDAPTGGLTSSATGSDSSNMFGSEPSVTGARNESSVLFSLSALTSGASSSRPSVPAPSNSQVSDDSGLIDLKALTESAQATAAAAPRPAAAVAAASPLGAPAPLGGAPSPLGAPATPMGASLPPAQKNNTGLYIAGGIVVAAIAVALIMTFGGKDEQPVIAPAPPAAPVAAPAPPPAPIPTAAPAALPTTEAKPPATGTEDDGAAPQAKPSPKPASKPRPTSTAPRPKPKPASSSPAPKPKPKVGKCGCKKDDLMCLMNCAQ